MLDSRVRSPRCPSSKQPTEHGAAREERQCDSNKSLPRGRPVEGEVLWEVRLHHMELKQRQRKQERTQEDQDDSVGDYSARDEKDREVENEAGPGIVEAPERGPTRYRENR